MGDDGTMLKGSRLKQFAKLHGLKIVTIKDIIEYRRSREKLVKREVETTLKPITASLKFLFIKVWLIQKSMLRLLRVKFYLKTCSCPCTFGVSYGRYF